MLQKLSINNYAIIDHIELAPDSGLNILTGETGAGKSIIIGALSLILGERADTSVLINKEEKCIVEAVFDVASNKNFLQALADEDLDDEQQCIIRREINPKGKSRAFVNDTPVRLDVLNRLTSMLVDLHQQFDHLAFEEEDFQQDVLDAVGGNMSLRGQFRKKYSDYQSTTKELTALQKKKEDWQKEADYKEYLYNELIEVGLRENELEETEQKLRSVNKAEEIQQAAYAAVQFLNEGERPVVNELQRIYKQLEALSDVLPDMQQLIDRLNTAIIELEDISDAIGQISDKFDFDEEEIQLLNDRIDIGYKLQKKHNVNATNELIEIARQLEQELQLGLNIDTDITKLEKEQSALLKELKDLGADLTNKRVQHADSFAVEVNRLLMLVGMPNALFSIEVKQLDAPTLNGFDEVQFYLDANKSGVALPVYKAASGGEMSRIMLCIKSLIAKVMDMPTLVFDEVDMGISGEAAKQVGVLLADLSKHHQIICITHQPQVAAKGDYHLYVFKEATDNEYIKTKVKALSEEERVVTIAKMLDGDNPSDAAVENAKKLIRA